VLAENGRTAPPLLFCFGSPRREQAARRALAATYRSCCWPTSPEMSDENYTTLAAELP